MTWTRLDEDLLTNAKVTRLSDGAFRVFVLSIVHCSKNLTDGAIDAGTARTYGWSRRAKELVTAGVWEVAADGWMVHDYLAYNPSRETVLKRRADLASRVAKHRSNSGSNADGNDVGNDVTHARSRIPVPLPDQNPSDSSPQNAREPRHKPVDEAFIAEMVTEFAGRLTETEIRNELAKARNRKQWDDYRDKRQHFHDWLERTAGYKPAANGARTGAHAGAYPGPPGSRGVAGGGVGRAPAVESEYARDF